MKLSNWNSYLQIGESTGLIYNSLSDNFLAVYDLEILDALKGGNFDSLSDDVKNQLKEISALVSKDKDEIEQLKNEIKRVDNDTSFFHLIVNPTLDCNLHCWYCYENHVRGVTMTESLLDSVKTLVNNRISENPDLSFIYISFFGGEPLLAFDNVVRKLLDWLRDRCNETGLKLHVQFTSNGVKINDEIINFLKEFDCAFQITLDGGKSLHDKVRFEKGGVPTYDRIVTNICNLVNAGISVVTRINYTQKNVESISEIINDFKKQTITKPEYLRFDLQKVWQDKPSEDEKLRIDESIKSYRNDLRNMGLNVANNKLVNYIRASCYADKTNEVLINYNGDVFACTARDFTKENRKGRLLENGKVEWTNSLFPNRNILKLTKDICTKCRIAPLCGGGCHQKTIEGLNHDFCNVGFTDKEIDDMILERFEEYFLNR